MKRAKNMKRLMDNRHLLYTLKESNGTLQKHIINHSKPDLVKSLCEICVNTLNGNVKLTGGQLKKLKRYKKEIRMMAQPKVSLSRKKKVLVQTGGFLPALVGALVSAVIGHFLSKI